MHFKHPSSIDKTTKIAKLGVSTALAAVLLTGCAGGPATLADASASNASSSALASGERHVAVLNAETAVAADPQNGAHRVALGNAYLDAGRFASAEAAFDEAMTLGENSPRVALSLALSLAGQAKYAQAGALLDAWEGMIAHADIGLAYALAGQPERGIHIMSNAIRAGENTSKLRQNLAYAYAVDGRWRDARVMVSQDVPAGEVGDRMAEWASLATAEAYQYRVASLLQVPVTVNDPGRPMHLALVNEPGDMQLAVHDTPDPQTELAAVETPAAQTENVGFQPVAEPAERYANVPQASAVTVEEQAIKRDTFDAQFAAAFAPSDPVRETLTGVTTDTARFISEPVVQSSPQRDQTPHSPKSSAVTDTQDGTHLIQLGSFRTERAALRAWDIYQSRFPELADHQRVITQAMVNGKRHYRVSASGFDRVASRNMCNRVKSKSGDGCISWAAAQPLSGAIDKGVRLARR